MLRKPLYIGLFICVPLLNSFAQHQWTDLGTQYWVNGVDVAFGIYGNQQQEWHRYLIAHNSGDSLYYWWSSDDAWTLYDVFPNANKVISYNSEHYGDFAVCSAFDDDIYLTTNGGQNWLHRDFPVDENKEFTTVEVTFHTGDPGQEIYVGTEAYDDLPTAYIYHSVLGHAQWDRLGGDEQNDDMYGLHVYDIECNHPGVLLAGTENGIFMHPGAGSYTTSWEQRSFYPDTQVVAVEDVPLGDPRNIAAVVYEGEYSLWYSPRNSYFDEDKEEIRPDDASFDKEVRDLSAVMWNSYDISCYAATSEGAYLLFFDRDDVSTCEAIDLKALSSTAGYHPMLYDQNCMAVDYIKVQEGQNEKLTALVATPFNVYQIVEVRDGNGSLVGDIEISDAVDGTYTSNVVSVALPEYSQAAGNVLTVSENGLIKQLDEVNNWAFTGLSFISGTSGNVGTDLTTDFGGTNDYILAASKTATGGAILYSNDGGIYWVDRSPQSHPIINSVDLDLVSDSAYAAGQGISNVWTSGNNGFDWHTSGSFNQPNFNDIYSDPDPDRDDYVYAGGSGNVKARMYNGSSWSLIENGLSSVSDIFQFAKNPDLNALYAATDLGVYKTTLGATTPAWSSRTNGTGVGEIGTVVCDPNNPYALLAATRPDAVTPHIWASGDSGRSWIDLPLGDIPGTAHINKLAASQDEKSGFVVGTDQGIFALGNIFRAGQTHGDEEWGPGVIILTGEFYISQFDTLTINSPCTIYAVYDFDSYDHDGKPKIEMVSASVLRTDLSGGGEVLFTSSRPTNPQPGDWEGIVIRDNINVELSGCVIQHADKAFDVGSGAELRLEDSAIEYGNDAFEVAHGATLYIDRCEITDMGETGITAIDPEALYVLHTTFENNKAYSISVVSDNCQAVDIVDVTIEGGFLDGIRFAGYSQDSDIPYIDTVTIINDEPQGTGISISDNDSEYPRGVISNTTVSGVECGIYITGTTYPVTVGPNVKCEENDWAGIVVEDAIADIEGAEGEVNSFIKNEIGIAGTVSHGKARWTDFGSNDYGGYLLECYIDFGNEEYEDPGMNSFADNESMFLDINNDESQAEVTAQFNWWGTTNTNVIQQGVTEYVIFLPILTENPLGKLGLHSPNLPDRLKLLNAFPNPFNANVQIEFFSPRSAEVSLKVYNVLGQEISELMSGHVEAGNVSVIWDGRDNSGKAIASGVYFCVVSANDQKDVKKLVLLK